MKMSLSTPIIFPFQLAVLGAFAITALAQNNPAVPTSDSDKIMVVPAPGPVVIDGKENDWDLSAGIWSYNDPTLVAKYSAWTHLMWDDKGIYLLVRYNDSTPLMNATRGKDFHLSWQADATQARVIFDDRTPEEHQMHVNLFYSSPESKPYMIVHHGGLRKKPPFDATGPLREDQLEKYSSTMETFGGKVAVHQWDDGKGYTLEAFWPWTYLRTSGKPLKSGESFTFGVEHMWGSPTGDALIHRLADNLKDDKVNRIFFFRDREGWGKAILSDKRHLSHTEEQKKLHATRLKQYVNYDTSGPVAIPYTLTEDRDVTIAIEDQNGQRVRNLIGQYPRAKGQNTDYWDGLDDTGKPVAPGTYSAIIVDHAPIGLRFINSLYDAATPPWATSEGLKMWGSNHGYPTSASTRGNVTLLGFLGTEGASGIMRVDENGRILWTEGTESLDVTLNGKFAFLFSRESWTKTVLIRRLDLATGAVILFDNHERSTEARLPIANEEVPVSSSVALAHGKLFACVPGKSLFRVDPDSGALEATLAVSGLIAVTERDDTLWGLFADGSVGQLGIDGKMIAASFVAKNLKEPTRLAVSQDSKRFAVSDKATNQVFVYDATGRLLQTIGEISPAVDGMRPAGKFIETNLINPLGLDFDAKGRLWLAESERSNRRVTLWSPEGKLEDQFWGGPDYGAMKGFPFVFDSTRFIAHGIEFQLDPQPDILNRHTREKPLVFHPALSQTRGVVYSYKGREYAVTVPGMNKQNYLTIAKRDKEGIFQPVVRVEYGDGKEPASAWIDRNDNRQVDAGETVAEVQGKRHYWSTGWVRPDLTFITPDQKVYRLKGLTETGVPLYDFENPETLPNSFTPIFKGTSGGTIVMDDAGNISDGIHFATVDGRRGSYPCPYGRHDAPAARRGLLIAPFRTNGIVENVPGVGSITALGGDRGEWFLMSTDGLYLSSIFQDAKADVTLDETFIGQESFGGFLWRDEKGRVMTQLGGPSYRLMEITGLETMRRNTLKIVASAAQIAEGERDAQARRDASPVEPASLRIARVAKLPTEAPPVETKETLIPGAPTVRIQESGNPARWFRVAMAHDGTHLVAAFQVNDLNPWKNAEARFTHAFIGGDAVDLQLHLPGRREIRLLAAPLGGENTVVYWQKHAHEKENPTTYVVSNNEANAQKFDVVKRLGSAKVSVQTSPTAYTVLITIPLADLGLMPDTEASLKGIAGVIFSDPSGTNRAQRLYWFDKATGMVSDVPTESKLDSRRWGPIQFDK